MVKANHYPGDMINHLCDMIEIIRYVKYDDIWRHSIIDFMLMWRKLIFVIGHFHDQFEV